MVAHRRAVGQIEGEARGCRGKAVEARGELGEVVLALIVRRLVEGGAQEHRRLAEALGRVLLLEGAAPDGAERLRDLGRGVSVGPQLPYELAECLVVEVLPAYYPVVEEYAPGCGADYGEQQDGEEHGEADADEQHGDGQHENSSGDFEELPFLNVIHCQFYPLKTLGIPLQGTCYFIILPDVFR